MAAAVPEDRPITRDDLRAGFASIQEEVDDRAETAAVGALVIGAAVVAAVVVVAFVLGRRKGKQDKTIVEIRRV